MRMLFFLSHGAFVRGAFVLHSLVMVIAMQIDSERDRDRDRDRQIEIYREQ